MPEEFTTGRADLPLPSPENPASPELQAAADEMERKRLAAVASLR